MEQILNESIKQNNNYNNFYEQQQEVEDNMALFDVAKELELQKQNFERYPFPNNINYSEVDPEFMHTFISE